MVILGMYVQLGVILSVLVAGLAYIPPLSAQFGGFSLWCVFNLELCTTFYEIFPLILYQTLGVYSTF